MSLLLLEGDLLVGLAVGAPVISSRKIVKRPGLLLRGACEVVVELAISRVKEKLAIRKGPLSFMESAWRTREYILVSACLGYFYTRAYFPCDSHSA